MFGVSFDEIAPMVERSPAAARQLASRARRRVRGAVPVPDVDLARQREVVDAFLAAARDGDFEALLAVLDPDVVLRADGGAGAAGASRVVRGARNVAEGALGSRLARSRAGARERSPGLRRGPARTAGPSSPSPSPATRSPRSTC